MTEATKTKKSNKKDVQTTEATRKASPPAWLLSNKQVQDVRATGTRLTVDGHGKSTYDEAKRSKAKEADERKLPRDGHITLAQAVDARNASRAGGLLKEDSDVFDYENYATFQIAVAECKDKGNIEAALIKLLGVKSINLDEAATASKVDRSAANDMAFMKEALYCTGTLVHLRDVRQTELLEYYSGLPTFQKRIADARYGRVKQWGEKGAPAAGARVPRMEKAPREKAPTILGFRVGSKIGKVAEKLLAAGKKGMTVAEFEAASGGSQANTIKRAVEEWKTIRMEKAEKRADSKLYAVTE